MKSNVVKYLENHLSKMNVIALILTALAVTDEIRTVEVTKMMVQARSRFKVSQGFP